MPPVALPDWKDKALFTPGPLTTSAMVKQAMLRDLGSRDGYFIEIVRDIRRRLVALSGEEETDYTAVLMQGSGTYSVEAVLSSTLPPDGKLLIAENGAYGRRMAQIARVLKLAHTVLSTPEREPVAPERVAAALAADPAITDVAVVHGETTTGLFNPVAAIGAAVRQAGRRLFVDAMSTFGAVPLDLREAGVTYLVSSANKCIEGVPGFGFVLARLADLRQTAGYARSLSLDLHAQWRGLEADGQFRFTPPTHALLAFHQALVELEMEGGVEGRAARYRANNTTVRQGMRALGFQEYLAAEHQGYIITSYRYPRQPAFDFRNFYDRLNAAGQVIYPGKVSDADCFRIGNIGRLTPGDMRALLLAISAVMADMELPIPLPPEGI